MKKLVFLLIAVITVNLAAQESVVLRYNYKKGDIYQIKMLMSQDMGAVMSQKTGSIMTQKTIDVVGDTIVNQTKIDKMVMDMNQGGQEMNYDSSKKEEDLDAAGKMMKEQMKPILSALVTTKSNGLGEVFSTVIEPNIPQVAQMGNKGSSVVYPKEALKVGSFWSSTNNESGMTMAMKYTVKSISDKVVMLTVSGDISGMGSGTISGDMTIDRSSGVASETQLKMKLDIQGQQMLMSVEGSMEKL
ncbi:DUF6263 family protein [Polaribacter sp. M15]